MWSFEGKIDVCSPLQRRQEVMYHALSKKLIPDEIFSFVIFYIETKENKR